MRRRSYFTAKKLADLWNERKIVPGFRGDLCQITGSAQQLDNDARQVDATAVACAGLQATRSFSDCGVRSMTGGWSTIMVQSLYVLETTESFMPGFTPKVMVVFARSRRFDVVAVPDMPG
jgi:hypothetical protein